MNLGRAAHSLSVIDRVHELVDKKIPLPDDSDYIDAL